MHSHQPTLKQPTRSGRLVLGLPTLIGSSKKKAPVCDGRCSTVKRCTKCLRKRRAQADDRDARQHMRKARHGLRPRRRARRTRRSMPLRLTSKASTTSKTKSTLTSGLPASSWRRRIARSLLRRQSPRRAK